MSNGVRELDALSPGGVGIPNSALIGTKVRF
jgi:hypothetical protein